jgi:hypothetical protein
MSKQKENKQEYIGIRLNKDLKEKYQKYCDDNCYSISKRIRYFIEQDLKNNEKTND